MEKSPRMTCRRLGEGGVWPSDELQIQNLDGRTEVGEGGRMQRASVFASVCMLVQIVNVCFSLSVLF